MGVIHTNKVGIEFPLQEDWMEVLRLMYHGGEILA